MPKKSLILLSLSTILIFGMLFSINMSISTQDELDDLESRLGDIEYRVQ